MSKSRIIPLSKLMSYRKSVYIEFRDFPSANQHLTLGCAMLWVDRVFKHYEIKNARYGNHYRFWTKRPTDEERSAAAWES